MIQEENKTQDNIVSQPQDTIQTQTSQEESVEQVNWREFRKKREEELKRAKEIEERAAAKAAEAEALKAALDAVLNKSQPQSEDEDDEEKRIERKIEEKFRKKAEEAEKERIQRDAQELPQKIRQSFSDFDGVCTQENMDYLEYHYPEVAAGLQYMPNSFEKWANVYKAIKRFIPNTDAKKEQKKIEQNLSKPQAMSVGGMTSTGDTAPRMLDEKRKEANWERMRKAMKGL